MHKHYCDTAGHKYDCSDGSCECVCGLPMEGHDHSDCPIELRPCPEHAVDQERPVEAVEPDAMPIDFSVLSDEHQKALPHCNCGCADADPDSIVGWCLWCTHGYVEYSPRIDDEHFALHCPGVPEEMKEMSRRSLAKRRSKTKNTK